MKLRDYKPKDYVQVKELLTICNLFDKSYDIKEKFDNKKPKGSIIVAEDKSRIIGFVLFIWDGWDSSIYRLAVHPDYRKKNIGTKLLKEAESRLKSLGADVVQLAFKTSEKEKENFFRKRGYYGNWGPYIWVEKRLK